MDEEIYGPVSMDQEFAEQQIRNQMTRKAMAAGAGGAGIGMILVLVVGAIFLLSHSKR